MSFWWPKNQFDFLIVGFCKVVFDCFHTCLNDETRVVWNICLGPIQGILLPGHARQALNGTKLIYWTSREAISVTYFIWIIMNVGVIIFFCGSWTNVLCLDCFHVPNCSQVSLGIGNACCFFVTLSTVHRHIQHSYSSEVLIDFSVIFVLQKKDSLGLNARCDQHEWQKTLYERQHHELHEACDVPYFVKNC